MPVKNRKLINLGNKIMFNKEKSSGLIFLMILIPCLLEKGEKHLFSWATLVAQTVKNLATNAGYLGFISGSGRTPGEGNGYPLQYSCLENPMEQRQLFISSQLVRHD